MRILLVSDYGTATGGAELMLLTLRDGLRARGHEVRLFSTTARPQPAEVADIESDYTCFGTTSRWRTLLQTANPWAARSLRQTLREFRADLVHVRLFLTQLSPSILPLLRDLPSVLHVDTYRTICPTGLKHLPNGESCHARAGAVCYRAGCIPLRDAAVLSLQMRWWRQRMSVFDRIVASSAWVQQRLSAEGVAVDAVIPNGVAEREARPPSGEIPTIAFAGRLVPEKGAHILLGAASRLRDEFPALRVLIAGEGVERAGLEGRRDALGLRDNVRFFGHIDARQREERLAGAWVQVVPSVWEEPFGNVAPEAMMRGSAVVASDTGGLSEILVHGEGGFLVPPGDPAALADALRPLLKDRRYCERVGAAGRQRALDQYSARLHTERMGELHASLVA